MACLVLFPKGSWEEGKHIQEHGPWASGRSFPACAPLMGCVAGRLLRRQSCRLRRCTHFRFVQRWLGHGILYTTVWCCKGHLDPKGSWRLNEAVGRVVHRWPAAVACNCQIDCWHSAGHRSVASKWHAASPVRQVPSVGAPNPVRCAPVAVGCAPATTRCPPAARATDRTPPAEGLVGASGGPGVPLGVQCWSVLKVQPDGDRA